MKKRNIKMIGLDLDGTLLNSEKRISEYTARVLRQAIEQGVIILPATGRPIAGIPQEVLDFPGIRYALTSNGARVLDLENDGRAVYESYLDPEYAKVAFKILRKYDAMREVYTNGRGYAAGKDLDHAERFMSNPIMLEYIKNTRGRVDDIEEYLEKEVKYIDKLHILFAKPEEEREEAFQKLKEALPDTNITYALENNIEINGKGASKGRGLIELGKLLGIERDEIMACGDGLNDREMVETVGFGVAMGNALDEVKAVAAYITGSNDEDGVAKAIEKFVLNC